MCKQEVEKKSSGFMVWEFGVVSFVFFINYWKLQLEAKSCVNSNLTRKIATGNQRNHTRSLKQCSETSLPSRTHLQGLSPMWPLRPHLVVKPSLMLPRCSFTKRSDLQIRGNMQTNNEENENHRFFTVEKHHFGRVAFLRPGASFNCRCWCLKTGSCKFLYPGVLLSESYGDLGRFKHIYIFWVFSRRSSRVHTVTA